MKTGKTKGSAALRRAVRQIILGAGVAAMGHAALADQLSREVEFKITSQRLAAGLSEFADQAGVQIISSGTDVENIATSGVVGKLSAEEALQALLRGTGLRYRVIDDHTIAIQPAESAANAGILRFAQADTGASGQAAAPAADGLDEVVVTSTVVFTQNDAFGATKMGVPLKDTPQTVNVVTRDMIEFASIESFNDFYKVDASGGPSHAIDNFPRNFYRGFLIQGNNAIRVDGFRMPADVDLDLATFDRFEVVKGPTSTLYGQNTIGGTLNAVSKIPKDVFSAQVEVEGGSHDDYRFDGDVTGALFGSDAWSYRLVTAYQDADSFLNGATTNLKLVAPSISFRPSEATTLMLRANYQRHEDKYHFGQATQLAGVPVDVNGNGAIDFVDVLTSIATDGLKVPQYARSQFFNAPWANATKEVMFVQSQGEHTFGNDWKLRANLQYSQIEVSTRGVYHLGPYDAQGFAYFSSVYAEDGENSLYGGEVNLFGNFEAFGHEHTLFFGVDFTRIDDTARTASDGLPSGTFDARDFSFLAGIPPALDFDDYTYIYDDDRESDLFGGTVQLITRPTDRLSILLGARASHDTLVNRRRFAASEADLDATPYATVRDFTFDEVTAQAGIVYELTPALNAYASYGETFEPSTRFQFDAGNPLGRAIDPEEGTSYEIGLKGDIGKALSYSVAAFHMERSNISQRDPQHIPFFVALGTQVSRGIEAEFKGRLTPAWNIFASAAYLDAEFDGGEFPGLQPANAPKFGLSVFSSYELLGGNLKGLGFGLGAVHKSGRKSFDSFLTRTLTNATGELLPIEYDFGSFTEVDARIFYGRDRWRVHVSVTNLLDEKYYSPTRNFLDSGIHVNPPTAIHAGLSYSF